ncbi:DUF3892 domain-containing protein [Bacillus smithii]|uniref:DUF3892 domain-containing protein n=1 Tax=Bacillus smithii TaxID=1479 RepID=UPI003D2026FF
MVEKWADYLISAVRYEDKNKKERIKVLKVHTDNGDKVGAGTDWLREDVISSIEEGYTYCTIYQKDGKWNKGAKVEIVIVDGSKYLRTDANKIKRDNLGELPEF